MDILSLLNYDKRERTPLPRWASLCSLWVCSVNLKICAAASFVFGFRNVVLGVQDVGVKLLVHRGVEDVQGNDGPVFAEGACSGHMRLMHLRLHLRLVPILRAPRCFQFVNIMSQFAHVGGMRTTAAAGAGP